MYLYVKRPITVCAGSLGQISFPQGHYVYVGSARRGIGGRIARHRRLAQNKAGRLHWHLDYLLVHRLVEWTGDEALSGKSECDVSLYIASSKGVSVPVPRFGASDCRAGCKSHLYRLSRSGIHNLAAPFKFARRKENGQGYRAALP